MDLTVYLPDEVGVWAKENRLNLSRLLRAAVLAERERRSVMSATLEDVETYELRIEDDDGRSYIGRVTGKRIAEDEHEIAVFLTDDERVILYEPSTAKYWVLSDPKEELRGSISPEAYVDAMTALGEDPVVDL